MDIREQILMKYKEFSTFLNNVDLESLKKDFTRQELNMLREEINNIPIRSLSYEISQKISEMKKEEFPQLLGVYRFPILNKMDILTETEKIELDKFLSNYRQGSFLGSLWKVIEDDEKEKQVEQWLIDHHVVEECYYLLCPDCEEAYVSVEMSKKMKEEFEYHVNEYKKTKLYGHFEEADLFIQYSCDECEFDTHLKDYLELEEIPYKKLLRLNMKRDTSLDLV